MKKYNDIVRFCSEQCLEVGCSFICWLFVILIMFCVIIFISSDSMKNWTQYTLITDLINILTSRWLSRWSFILCQGCEYHGYSSDITRTWPVDGRFSQPQRDLYEAVLSVQTELIRMCATLPSLDNLFHAMCTLLGQHLQELGVLSSRATEEELSRVSKVSDITMAF